MVLFKNRTTEAINSSASFINIVNGSGLFSPKTQTEYIEYLDLYKQFKEVNSGNLSIKGFTMINSLIRLTNDIVNDSTKYNQFSKNTKEKFRTFYNIVENDYSDMAEDYDNEYN